MYVSNRNAIVREEMERKRKMSGSSISAVREKEEDGSTAVSTATSTATSTAAVVSSLIGEAAGVGSTASSSCTWGCMGLLCMVSGLDWCWCGGGSEVWCGLMIYNNDDSLFILIFFNFANS